MNKATDFSFIMVITRLTCDHPRLMWLRMKVSLHPFPSRFAYHVQFMPFGLVFTRMVYGNRGITKQWY